MFGSVKSPPKKGGRPRSITPDMLEALCDYLLERPTLYLNEMAIFCRTDSLFKQRNRALAALLRPKAGPKKICPSQGPRAQFRPV